MSKNSFSQSNKQIQNRSLSQYQAQGKGSAQGDPIQSNANDINKCKTQQSKQKRTLVDDKANLEQKNSFKQIKGQQQSKWIQNKLQLNNNLIKNQHQRQKQIISNNQKDKLCAKQSPSQQQKFPQNNFVNQQQSLKQNDQNSQNIIEKLNAIEQASIKQNQVQQDQYHGSCHQNNFSKNQIDQAIKPKKPKIKKIKFTQSNGQKGTSKVNLKKLKQFKDIIVNEQNMNESQIYQYRQQLINLETFDDGDEQQEDLFYNTDIPSIRYIYQRLPNGQIPPVPDILHPYLQVLPTPNIQLVAQNGQKTRNQFRQQWNKKF